MRKCFFLVPIAALLMASCSNSDDIQQPAAASGAPSLQVYPVVNGLTRGTVWTNSNFASFHLTTSGDGFVTTDNGTDTPAAIDANVTKSDGKWGFGSTTYYWPSKKSSNNFLAYSPTTFSLSSDYEANSTDLSKLEDILVAYNSGTASDFSAGVPLNFRHATSQIIVKADNVDAGDVKIEVKGIRLNNITNKAGFTAPTSSTVSGLANPWTLRSSTADYKVSQTASTLSATASDITGSNPLLLLPQQLGAADIAAGTGQYISVLVKITNVADGKAIYPVDQVDASNDPIAGTGYAWVAVNVNTLWEPGKKYVYTLHFTKDGYGKIDGDQGDGGTDDPADPTPEDDTDDDGIPEPGDDVVDSAVELVLDVTVSDWVEVTESHDL